ncbi:MAG: formylglycine-generating enzyme family protein [Candidatus Nomurabacteria bacterium]|jgi:hypothetical protein|nr:formylglycine-generating enzyme family protein [Candidatus Nomurabacteria bacterium]
MGRGFKKTKRELSLRASKLHRHFLPCVITAISVGAVFLSYMFLTSDTRLNSDLSYTPTQQSGFNIALAVGNGVNASIALTSTDSETEGDSVTCNLTPANITSSGAIITCKATITVNTATSGGYIVSLSSQGNENRLVGVSGASGSYITPVSGTFTIPAPLTNGTWGYAMPSAHAAEENGFDESYIVAEKDTNSNTDVNSSYDEGFANAKYAAIPTSTTPINVRTTSGQASNDTFEIYFATKIDMSVTSGNYSGGVVISIEDVNQDSSSDITCENGNPISNCIVSIDENMIPITYKGTDASKLWAKADLNVQGEWYNYTNHRWANAVTLNNTTVKYAADGTTTNPTMTALAYFKSAPAGALIPEADVLGYYVYIPRYKYQVCRPNASDPISFTAGQAPSDGKGNDCPNSLASPYNFNIRFQTASQTTEFDGVTAGQWATHPAFTITDDTNAENVTTQQINGFWMGKFETTGLIAAPTVKPSLYPLGYRDGQDQNLLNQFKTAKSVGRIDMDGKTASAANRHNFASNVDASLVSNRQWGAIAYLALSTFGRGTSEMYINRNDHTGAGYQNANGAAHSSYDAYYNGVAPYTSTTNNVYGVYDMSGSEWESTLSNYSNGYNIGNPVGSGFYVNTDDSNQYFEDVSNKYFSLFQSTIFTNNNNITNFNQCTWEQCGGQALHETKGVQNVATGTQSWYGEYSYFSISTSVWMARGGSYGDQSYAGMFASTGVSGIIGSAGYIRITLVI